MTTSSLQPPETLQDIMEANTRASQADSLSFSSTSPKINVGYSSSCKEKKILQGRRQQRHSTEIGSEYHRWWVVRNALGFETNEHIAGLLLDGFHGLLQQLVVMCGGETYQPSVHGEAKSSCDSSACFEDLALSSSSSSSSTSPPGGIENMDEFLEYKNAVTHYCDSLWRICCQHGSQLQQLDQTSQPVQEFLIRLMGYLRTAKGKSFCINPKKKQFKPNNVRVKNTGEESSSQSRIAKLCPAASSGQHESHSNVMTNSNQPAAMDVTRVLTCDLQKGWTDKCMLNSSDTNKNLLTEVGDNIEGYPTGQAASKENVDKSNKTLKTTPAARFLFEDLNSNSLLQTHIQPLRNEQKKPLKHKKVIQSAFPQSETQVQNTDLTPPSKHQQEAAAAVSFLPPVQQRGNTSQQHSLLVHEANKEQLKQGNTALESLDVCNNKCEKTPEHTSQDKQQTNSLDNKQTAAFGDKDSSINLWDHAEEKYSSAGIVPHQDAGAARPLVDFAFKVCGNTSSADATRAEDKPDGEFGFLLTDPLKMLPCIDEEITDAPQLQQSSPDGKDKTNAEKLPNPTDLRASSVRTVVSERQVQSSQTNICMILPAGNLSVSGVVTTQSQSLLPNMDISKQKAKQTQTMATNTSFYNEIKINLNNPQRISEVKSQKVASYPPLQPIQPAMFSAVDKPSSVTASLGTPVILYPARSFSSSDNSLASLSSLVHNIVYSSYGTILKPLSLTSLASSVSYTTPQLSSPLSVSAVDSCSQRKPIAAALPVLSSQLSMGKPTLVPFYISHTAVNTLANISQCTGLSGPPGSILSEPQTPAQPLLQQQPAVEISTATNIHQDRSSFGSQTSLPHVSSPLNMLQVTDTPSCSNTEFAGIGQVRNETLISQVSNSIPVIPTEIGQKLMKTVKPAPFIQSISVTNSEGGQQYVSNEKFDSSMKQSSYANIKPAVTAVYDYPEHYKPSCYSRHTSGSHSESLEKVLATPNTIAQFEQLVPSTKSNSKILNSLLASNEASYNTEVYSSRQINNSNWSMSSSESTVNTNQCMDSKETVLYNITDTSVLQENMSQKNIKESRSEQTDCIEQNNSECNDGVAQKTLEQKDKVADSLCISKHTVQSRSSSLPQKSTRLHRLVCPSCHVLFFSSMDLLVHRFEQHGHVCGECDSRFLTLSRLNQHKQADHPPILMCSLCRFYTFKKEDLADHTWSEHGIMKSVAHHDEDETATCELPDSFMEEKEAVWDSFKTGTLKHKCNVDCPVELCGLPSHATKCPSSSGESGSGSNKPRAFDKVKKSGRASCTSGRFEECHMPFGTCLHGTDCKGELEIQDKFEKEAERNVLSTDNDLDNSSGHPEQTCYGSVFPSFTREASETAQSDSDTISSVYAQVSQHCQLDTSDFLHMSDNEEPRLVIDTDPSCYREGCKDNFEQQDEKVLQNDGTGSLVSSIGRTKNKDGLEKVADAGSHTGQDRHKSACSESQPFSNSDSLGQSEATSEVWMEKDYISSLHVDGKGNNMPESEGRERERIVMSISVKRRSSTPVHERQSRRKKRTRSNRNARVHSNTDDPKREINYNKGFCISTDSFTKWDDCCSELPVASYDQASLKTYDTCESRCSVDFCQMKESAPDLYDQCMEMTKTELELLDTANSAKTQVDQGSSHLEKLYINSDKLQDGIMEDIGGFKTCALPEKVLSLRERHVMSSLPPKKRKLKKCPRVSRDPHIHETPSHSQSIHGAMLRTNGPVNDVSETQSLIRTAVHVSEIPKKKNRTEQTINEQLGADGNIIPDCEESLLSVQTAGGTLENKTEAAVAESEPHLTETGQLLKISSGRFECPMSSCKVTFGRRWNMKDHLTKVHARSSAIVCSVPGCDLKFSNKRELRQHITVDHLGKTRKYMCSWPDCSKGFFARTHLSIHMLTHTGEKPVACHICDYRCRQRTALIWHLRKHGVFHKTGNVKNHRSCATFSV